MDDKEKYQALMQLAYHMIDEDALKNVNRSAQEQDEDKETLKAVFAATWENMGQRNSRGDKRGITRKINPRILALGLSIASSMSENRYEKLRLSSPYLPSWSTVCKYKKTVRIYIIYYVMCLLIDISSMISTSYVFIK